MTGERLRVCHVITGLELGGAETMLAKLCEHVSRARIEQSVVALRGGGVLGARVREAGVPLHEGGMRAGRVPGPGDLRWLRRTLRGIAPRVVQGWMYHGNVAATITRPRRVPVLWNVRQTLYEPRRERPLTRATIHVSAWLSAMPRAIVYNSTLSAEQHEALGYRRDRRRIIPNGFDTRVFSPAAADRAGLRRELGVGADTLVVGLVARAHAMKDHPTFLDAARGVLASRPDVHFVLAGEGTEPEGRIAALARDAGLQERVHLLGARHDMPRLTASLDVACSASAWGEGFPNVLGEAMACGVPCVTTNVGDSATVVGQGGLVVPPRDPRAMASAIIDLLEDGNRRAALGAAGRTRAVEAYSIESVAERYATMYENVAQSEPHA